MSVSDLEALEETLDLLSTPGALHSDSVGQNSRRVASSVPRIVALSSTRQRMPRSSASTRAWGRISWAAKAPRTGASSGPG